MKKALTFGLIIVFTFSLIACNPFSDDKDDGNDENEIVW